MNCIVQARSSSYCGGEKGIKQMLWIIKTAMDADAEPKENSRVGETTRCLETVFSVNHHLHHTQKRNLDGSFSTASETCFSTDTKRRGF